MEIDKYLNVKYELKSSEQFNEYLQFLEIDMVTRAEVCALYPVDVLTKDGDIYTYTVTTPIATLTYSCKLNEEFTMTRFDGVQVKSLVEVDGNCATQTETEANGRKSVHKRIFTPEKLTQITTADGWSGECVRVYEAINV